MGVSSHSSGLHSISKGPYEREVGVGVRERLWEDGRELLAWRWGKGCKWLQKLGKAREEIGPWSIQKEPALQTHRLRKSGTTGEQI